MDSISYTGHDRLRLSNLLFLSIYVPVVLIALMSLVKARREIPPGITALMVLTLSYFVFHSFFGVRTPGIYSTLVLVPWITS